MKKIVLVLISLLLTVTINAQFLSNLKVKACDPLYTTYAAPMSRTNYKLDQGYQMMWYDPQQPLEFMSQNGMNWGFVLGMDSVFRSHTGDFHDEIVVHTSYNDIVKFSYQPYRKIQVKGTFNVHSSAEAFYELTIINNHCNTHIFQLTPYIYRKPGNQKQAVWDEEKQAFRFVHHKARDGWMKNHNIPLVEDMEGYYIADHFGRKYLEPLNDTSKVIYSRLLNKPGWKINEALVAFEGEIELAPGDSVTLRMMHGWARGSWEKEQLDKSIKRLSQVDINTVIQEAEQRYSSIPEINTKDREKQLMYWSAYTLMHQCMMPPEGESSYNYYVFSREPRWGWGYGGQVFHESLVMMAYAYMDPVGAMNSQRVYMERQHKNGYINYRTGPYLNESIPRDSLMTSSAPWFNYQNWEIYKITRDRKFLSEAYESGKAYYEYMNTTRDKDNDGLLEWGAHAVLESVRDARVAVWDKVGWPSHFEGPDINSMMVMEAKALREMALELGRSTEALEWKTKARKRSELVNRYCWNKQDGFYYNVDKTDEDFTFEKSGDLRRKEIIGFLPMWAGISENEHMDGLLFHFDNEKEFHRAYGVPTLSASDPYYNPIGYWNGPIWAQWQYLLIRGLRDYGYQKRADDLTERVMDNVIYHLKKDHTFWEFYSADDLQAGWNRTYIWTGIVARMLLDMQKLPHKE